MITLEVFFEEPFWVGIFEKVSNERLSVCKVIFGSEPKEREIYEFVLKNYCRLRFSPYVSAAVKKTRQNPKRIQREIRKCLKNDSIGTKSQQALKLQHEQIKTERKVILREKRKAEKQYQFELKQQKKKEKHKGR